jgi:UDP-N-acetyl-D-mannosaminuronate dehydrogenase
LANELSLAYPDKDMREVLKLVGTKWNMNKYYPGFGTGGYCIPLSSKYVRSGSRFPNKLKIINETIKLDSKINEIIGKSILNKKLKNILVLGLSYKANLKVHILSPTIQLINYLRKNSTSVSLYDPLYSKKEIEKILKVKIIEKIDNLKKFDAIVMMINHKLFKTLNLEKLIKNSKIKLVLDNSNFFANKNLKLNKTKYIQTGQANWLN